MRFGFLAAAISHVKSACGAASAGRFLATAESGTKGAVHESVGRRGTLTSPLAGLTSSGAFGALASMVTDTGVECTPAGGGVTATPVTSNVYVSPTVGCAVCSVSVVEPPGLSCVLPNVAVVPGGRFAVPSVTGEVKLGPLSEST